MTKLEEIKKEMAARGCRKSQINAKVVPVVLDIVVGAAHTYEDLDKARDALAITKGNLDGARLRLQRLNTEIMELTSEVTRLRNDKQAALKEAADGAIEYIEQFNAALANAETAEFRDRLKAMQLFVNTVEIGTKYDNTAFIVALGALLAGGNYDPIEQLKAINTKLVTNQTILRRRI